MDTKTIKLDETITVYVNKKTLAATLFTANVAVGAFLALTLLAGCQAPMDEFGRVLGCTAKGNNCNSQGADGTSITGPAGNDGQDGRDGSSCTVQQVLASPVAPNGGARISCTDGTDSLVLNGTNGTNAPSVIGIQQVVKPCPTIAGSMPELFLILTDRTIVASISDSQTGAHTRLAAVTPGSYVTTDSRSCAVTVTASTVSWAGGSVTY